MADEDFDLDSLAAYLHMTPAQISKLADRGDLPGRKVVGKWRFSSQEMHHWLERRIGLADEEGLVKMETVLERNAPEGNTSFALEELLLPEAVGAPLVARTRGSVIQAMTELAVNTGHVWDSKRLAEAVRAREEMYPTALEVGVALLHPRRPLPQILGQALVACGITSGGVPFGGSRLTDIFFLICSVDDAGHLRTLARLSRLASDSDLLAALRSAPDPAAVRDLLLQRDRELG